MRFEGFAEKEDMLTENNMIPVCDNPLKSTWIFQVTHKLYIALFNKKENETDTIESLFQQPTCLAEFKQIKSIKCSPLEDGRALLLLGMAGAPQVSCLRSYCQTFF